MTLQEFQTAIHSIVMRWPRAYSGDQLQLLFDEMKMIPRPDLDRVVKHLLGSSRVAPMIPDFKKAVNDLAIRPAYYHNPAPEARTIVPEDFEYQIRDNIWANNDYVFIRGTDIRTNSFISKKDYPDHPLVKEDAQVRSFKISVVKKHLENKTYNTYMDGLKGNSGLRLMKFENMEVV